MKFKKVHAIPFLPLLFLTICPLLAINGAEKCAEVSSYQCPVCGGITVSDCLDCDGYHNTDEEHKQCFKRRLFDTSNLHYHFLGVDIAASFIWFIAAGIATACGVGGGGIYVPLGMILMKLSPKVSSGLSQASIFGASLGGIILNARDRHPNEKIRDDGACDDDVWEGDAPSEQEYLAGAGKLYTRPLIDYDMALFMAPMEMAGAVMGVIIQRLLPNWLYLMIAGVILLFTSFKTYQKFFTSYEAEKEVRRISVVRVSEASVKRELKKSDGGTAKSEIDSGLSGVEAGGMEMKVVMSAEATPLLHNDGNRKYNNDQNISVEITQKNLKQETLCRKYLEEDSCQYPLRKIASLIILWMGLVVITFLKGGKGVESLVGIDCTSPFYAALVVTQFVWTLGFATVSGFMIVKRQEAKDACHYPILKNDVHWTFAKTQFYAAVTFVAGVVAGLIGIGGGMVLGPVMLIMGIHPRVSSATTATMIVLTSSSVAVMFVTSGMVPVSYAAYYFSICFCGAYVGKRVIDDYIKRTGMASVLIFILGTIILLSTAGCFYNMFSKLASSSWCFDGLKKFCDVKLNEETTCDALRLLLPKSDILSP